MLFTSHIRHHALRLIWIALLGCLSLCVLAEAHAPLDGVVFSCDAHTRPALQQAMIRYMRELRIDPRWVSQTHLPDGRMAYTLKTSSTSTLDLARHPYFHLRNEVVVLMGPKNQPKQVRTVSRKEILLSLFHPGRATHFTGSACQIDALRKHVGVRQNIVAWLGKIEWAWPDGEPARWSPVIWQNGTPRNLSKLDDALLDAFINPKSYALGCYTASKLSYAHDQATTTHKSPHRANYWPSHGGLSQKLCPR